MKMLDFAIGKKLPLDILMQPVFLEATRGWGKTSTAKALYEAGHDAGAQCISIAPTGKWWSLRLGLDGKSVGYADVFVFGGPHGDVPLTPESGAMVARVLVEKRLHAVIDVSLMRKGQRARFLADLFEEFWLLKKLENDSYPVVFFIEEAHAVAPQKPQPDEARMLGAIEDIASEGRNHGIGIVFLDQRAARVNKNVLALVEVLIVGRVIHPLDLKANGDWVIDKGAEDRAWLKELPSLESGEAYVYAPVLGIFERVRIRMPHTFNATATAKIGERVVKAGALTQVDISGLRDAMAQVIVEAEKNDPRAMRAEIARLKGEIAKKPAAAPAAKALPPVEVPVLNAADRQAMDRLSKELEEFGTHFQQLAEKTGEIYERLAAIGKKFSGWNGPAPAPARLIRGQPPPPGSGGITVRNGTNGVEVRGVNHPAVAKPAPVRHHAATEGDGEIGEGHRKMLAALASVHPETASHKKLGALSGFSAKGGTFRKYRAQLRTAGLIDYDDQQVRLTDLGLAEVKHIIEAAPRTTDEILNQWRGKLDLGPGRMFNELAQVWPQPMSRQELGQRTDYEREGGTFRKYIAQLKTRGLVEYIPGDAVKLVDDLFPTGAP